MINRRKSKEISIGNIKIGGDNPISVQSMCNTDTRDIEATSKQIKELTDSMNIQESLLNKNKDWEIRLTLSGLRLL